MSVTPRATPVIQAPAPSSVFQESAVPQQLKAPIVVVTAGAEWEHETGELIIGRDGEANIVLDDPLVSRFHARLSVASDGRVALEDLHSANGVFVNGNKLSRPSVFLGEGDRLLIGTTEVSVFGLRTSAMVRLGKQLARVQQPNVTVSEMRVPEKAAPSSTTGSRSQGSPTPVCVPRTMANSVAPAEDRTPAPVNRRGAAKRTLITTGKSDAVNLVGQFAEQLMDSGHALEAVRTLSEHLQNLLKGASAGLSVPPRILESATHYALRLHSWTGRDAWVEYVLELHLSSHQFPSDSSLRELDAAILPNTRLDADLVRYFVKTTRERGEPETPEQRRFLERLTSAEAPPPRSER